MLFGMNPVTEQRRISVSFVDGRILPMLLSVGFIAPLSGMEHKALNDSGHGLRFTNANEQYNYLRNAFDKLVNKHSALENMLSQHLNDVQRNENNPGYTGDDDTHVINLRASLLSNEEQQATLLGDIKKFEQYVFDEFHKCGTRNEGTSELGQFEQFEIGQGQYGQIGYGQEQPDQGHRGPSHRGQREMVHGQYGQIGYGHEQPDQGHRGPSHRGRREMVQGQYGQIGYGHEQPDQVHRGPSHRGQREMVQG
uniref:Uncharacterized protein n=1 Tax=Meloidogyne incognita TaxID=6306 RepID=A0A914NPU9_MELIC